MKLKIEMNAIKKLKNDKTMRQRLSDGALLTAEGLSITHRAERIISFMKGT